MTWVALKSLMERRTRAALTALAVVLGAANVFGAFVVTDRMLEMFKGRKPTPGADKS